MIFKYYGVYLFIIFFTLFTNKSSKSVDDSDILVDRVFMTAVKKSRYQKVEEMLNKDAAVNYKDSKKMVALAYALEKNDKRMFDLLIANGANVKVKILNQSSLLIFYVSLLKYAMIEDLISAGVDINYQDRLGMTALMHAIEKANVNAVNILVRTDFNLDLTDFSGKNIHDYALSSRNVVIKKLVESLK